MATDLSEALRWLDELLDGLGIEYQVVGGLAARCYGSTRPLVDIDLYVPDNESVDRIASAARAHVKRFPEPFRDEHWDLTFMALEREGWTIEIGVGKTAKVWDRVAESWIPAEINFAQSEIVEIEGIECPVMPKDELVRYKNGLGREVDRRDLDAMRIHPAGPSSTGLG